MTEPKDYGVKVYVLKMDKNWKGREHLDRHRKRWTENT